MYGWASNKGYGAPVHRAAILSHGVHPEHRRVFIENLLQLQLDLGFDAEGTVPLAELEAAGAATAGGPN